MVVDESFDEDEVLKPIGIPEPQSTKKQTLNASNLLSLPGKFNKDKPEDMFINNDNKDMDLSTKIAPESDRGDKKTKKKTKSKIKVVGEDEVAGEAKKTKKKKGSNRKRLVMNVSQTKY